jgi:acetyl esterase/lipase
LQDAQRAVGIVRHRAKDFGIDPHRIGVLGFSVGAHLAAALSAAITFSSTRGPNVRLISRMLAARPKLIR